MEDQYPQGKLNENDEGVLTMGVTEQDNTIIIAFGKPITWIGLSKLQTVAFAKLLLAKAGYEEEANAESDSRLL